MESSLLQSPQPYILESFPGVPYKAELYTTSDREWPDTQLRILGHPPSTMRVCKYSTNPGGMILLYEVTDERPEMTTAWPRGQSLPKDPVSKISFL